MLLYSYFEMSGGGNHKKWGGIWSKAKKEIPVFSIFPLVSLKGI
jgi:hypothetical protein